MIGITITTKGGPKQQLKQLIPILNDSMGVTVEKWHHHMLPDHFKNSARGRYHYRRRSRKYEISKMRNKGHSLPLVHSGTMKRQSLRAVEIRKYKSRAEVHGKIRARALNFSGRSWMPDMKAELLATTRSERNSLAATVQREVTKRLNKIQTTETIKVA